MTTPDTALVVGAGDSLGAALARRFAREGLKVVVVRRNADQLQPLADSIKAAGGTVHAMGCDARKEDQVVSLFERIERDIGQLEVVVANVGGNIRFPLLEMTAQKYFKVWEMACFSAFLTARGRRAHVGGRAGGARDHRRGQPGVHRVEGSARDAAL
ncbi:MAG: SDR family NAD(P)-dependent oxidoreductase, partial [Betaproteobacteria bacterium]|nr:SDR family NAD(P)-dependent oxidoreductase [Betaproteobacteria bacterium]